MKLIATLNNFFPKLQYIHNYLIRSQNLLPQPNMSSQQNPSCNGNVRRMVSLPRSLFGRFSRVIGGPRRTLTQNHTLVNNSPTIIPKQQQEELDFVATFERQYGPTHPSFYSCRFAEAAKIAKDDKKLMFMYLHSQDHPFAHSFCGDTLCCEVVVQYLDANFVCWGGLESRGEGFQMAQLLRPSSFPFCAVIAPSSGDNIAVLQQIEGPVSPTELVEILQMTVEEQGRAFRDLNAKEIEKIKADRRLREEQDLAYLAALQIDEGKERLNNNLSLKESGHKANHEKSMNNSTKKNSGHRVIQSSTTRVTQQKETTNKIKDSQATQILIRFPNGERREQSFSSSDKVQAIFRFIDSLNLPGIGNYRLVSNFPRRVYGVDQMSQTLKDSGLHPRASLFLETM